MGMNTVAFKCDGCGQTLSKQYGPNFTVVPAPAPLNWVVAVMSCPNPKCQKPLGIMSAPAQ
jgi:hypothetical protein